ncbi:MAG: hypothetical protein LBU43_04160 [Candidatus Accumulibacter sp.]|jgi:hypothetical protein|nr:hypothetical protein [Accumulibacter sp.]
MKFWRTIVLQVQDRRGFLDKRVVDEGPAPEMQERRVRVERRGFKVEEFDFDERIIMGQDYTI